MKNVLDILILGFTLNSAALILPTIAAVYGFRVDARNAFWSISLSLLTVIVWYLGGAFELGPVFGLAPLWPGLIAAFLSFFGLMAWRSARPVSVRSGP